MTVAGSSLPGMLAGLLRRRQAIAVAAGTPAAAAAALTSSFNRQSTCVPTYAKHYDACEIRRHH